MTTPSLDTPAVARSSGNLVSLSSGGDPASWTLAKPRHVIVPLDGSTMSERAVAVGVAFGARWDAPLHFLCVAETAEEEETLRRYVERLEARTHTSSTIGLDRSSRPERIITTLAAGLEDSVICMASHGRGRLANALLGSVTGAVVATAPRPVIVVGPHSEPAGPVDPVVVYVDGSRASEQALAVADTWSALLNVGLEIVTVAEPMEPPLGGPDGSLRYHRSFGPDDPGEYVRRLATTRFGARRPVPDATALFDPVGPTSGLASYLREHPAQLVVVAAHANPASLRPFVGGAAAHLVRQCPAPVAFCELRPT